MTETIVFFLLFSSFNLARQQTYLTPDLRLEHLLAVRCAIRSEAEGTVVVAVGYWLGRLGWFLPSAWYYDPRVHATGISCG